MHPIPKLLKALLQLEITPQLKVLGGTRYDVFEAKQNDMVGGLDFTNTVKQFSPRAGLVWQRTGWQSYYFSYEKSFNPSAETFNLTAATGISAPSKTIIWSLAPRSIFSITDCR